MNLKKAKALRKLARSVFLKEKEAGNENMKNFELDEVVWLENTKRRVITKEQDYALVQAFDANGLALKNEDGTPKLISSPSVNPDGTPKMRDVDWAPGTITVHPFSARGIYRNLKKNTKKISLWEVKNQMALFNQPKVEMFVSEPAVM